MRAIWGFGGNVADIMSMSAGGVQDSREMIFVKQAAAHDPVGIMAVGAFNMTIVEGATHTDLAQRGLRFDKVFASLLRGLRVSADGTNVVHFHAGHLFRVADGHVSGQAEVAFDVGHFRV